jgi:hypothetical protein
MEVADWIPFLLTGKTHVGEAVHNMCTATTRHCTALIGEDTLIRISLFS